MDYEEEKELVWMMISYPDAILIIESESKKRKPFPSLKKMQTDTEKLACLETQKNV